MVLYYRCGKLKHGLMLALKLFINLPLRLKPETQDYCNCLRIQLYYNFDTTRMVNLHAFLSCLI